MPSNGPEKFNPALTDEIAREAFCTAARYGTKLIKEASDSAEGRMIVAFDERLSALADFMHGAAEGMDLPKDEDDVHGSDEF